LSKNHTETLILPMTETNSKTTIKLTRSLILNLALILKVVPMSWLYALDEVYQMESNKIVDLLHGLRRDGFVTFEQRYPGEKFIYLTQKGFDRASQNIPPSYSYRSWSKGANRTETIFRNHHYITFRFLLSFLANYEQIATVYTDYDREECRLAFTLGRHDYYIYPDSLLRLDTEQDYNKLICLESDTGQEEIKKIFDKLLRYLIFIHRSFLSQNLEQIKIYFSFKTQRRADSIFKLPTGSQKTGLIYPLFDQDTRISFYQDKTPDSLGIREFFSILLDNQIEIYTGLVDTEPKDFEKVDLLNNILSCCPETRSLFNQLYPEKNPNPTNLL